MQPNSIQTSSRRSLGKSRLTILLGSPIMPRFAKQKLPRRSNSLVWHPLFASLVLLRPNRFSPFSTSRPLAERGGQIRARSETDPCTIPFRIVKFFAGVRASRVSTQAFLVLRLDRRTNPRQL